MARAHDRTSRKMCSSGPTPVDSGAPPLDLKRPGGDWLCVVLLPPLHHRAGSRAAGMENRGLRARGSAMQGGFPFSSATEMEFGQTYCSQSLSRCGTVYRGATTNPGCAGQRHEMRSRRLAAIAVCLQDSRGSERLSPLSTNSSLPAPSPPAPGTRHCAFRACGCDSSRDLRDVESGSNCPFVTGGFSQCDVLSISPYFGRCQNFIPFLARRPLRCALNARQRTLELLPPFGCGGPT